LILLLLSLAVFIAAFAARGIFLPNVGPIASADEPQSLWALEAAFLLRALENVSALCAVLVLASGVTQLLGQRIGLLSSIPRK
jgi:hypothetical protein